MSLALHSVAETTPRYNHGPQTFDAALREFGFDDPWLRGWLAGTIDSLYGRAGWEGEQFWIPPHARYVAAGQPRKVRAYIRHDSIEHPNGGDWSRIDYPSSPTA